MKLQSLRRDLWWKAFQWSARLNRPGLAAWLLDRAIEGAGGSAVSDGEPANILVLDKPGMSEDARAAFDGDPRFRLFVLDTVGIKAFKAMVSAFLPPEVDDNNYVNDTPAAAAGRAAYRAFMARTWAALAGRRRIDAVLTGNYAYYAERELQAVLEARGTPFIAPHKENLKSEGRGAFFIDIYRNRRGPFAGRRILVYNAIEREVQIAAGIAAAESVTVTGMPRLDRMHAWRRLAATARPAPSRRPRKKPESRSWQYGRSPTRRNSRFRNQPYRRSNPTARSPPPRPCCRHSCDRMSFRPCCDSAFTGDVPRRR